MKDTKNVLAKVKVHLLQHKPLTSLQALQLFGTMRLAEYIRLLRHNHGLNIITTNITNNGKTYASYSIPRENKTSRIKSRAYLEQ